MSTVCRVVKGVGVGVILSVQGTAFVREPSQENPRNDAVAAPSCGRQSVLCVRERVQEPQCGKQQLIDLYELYQGAYVFNGSNSLQKISRNSMKQRPSNVDSRSDDE